MPPAVYKKMKKKTQRIRYRLLSLVTIIDSVLSHREQKWQIYVEEFKSRDFDFSTVYAQREQPQLRAKIKRNSQCFYRVRNG